MPFPQQESRPFTREGIEWLKPNQNGVYGIFNSRTWIYIGRGDLRDRLLAHFSGTGGGPCILRNNPTHYVSEVTSNDALREKQLIIEFNPVCNQKVG
jgi:hypothetical protein